MTSRKASIKTVAGRAAIKPGSNAHWEKLDKGKHVGYRPSRHSGAPGTWWARWWDAEQHTYELHELGALEDVAGAERYAAAAKAAAAWCERKDGGAPSEELTVWEACTRYAKHKPSEEGRLARWVQPHPIAKRPLRTLKPRHINEWREHVSSTEAVVARTGRGMGRGRGTSERTRPRSEATINRDMSVLRAALNLALEDGFIATNVWKKALKPIKGADRQGGRYIEREGRTAMLEAMPKDLAPLARAWCLLPLRPQVMAGMLVRDYNPKHRTVRIGTDKSGEGRTIPISGPAAALLDQQRKGKLPMAHMFTREDGQPWNSERWKKPIKQAAKAAGLPPETTAYDFRHSTITDLVSGGLDLFTVAKLSGTSVAMIEKHYGHLQQAAAVEALEGLAI